MAQKQKPLTPIEVAEILFKRHTHASQVYEHNPDQIVYTEADVISIIAILGAPAPDFDGFAKLTKAGHITQRQEEFKIAEAIKKGMKAMKLNNTQLAKKMNVPKGEITRALSGTNMTVATIRKYEIALNIKILNL